MTHTSKMRERFRIGKAYFTYSPTRWYIVKSAGVWSSDYLHSDGIIRKATMDENNQPLGYYKTRQAARDFLKKYKESLKNTA